MAVLATEAVFTGWRAGGVDRLVLLTIANCVNRQGVAFPGVRYIAARAATTEPSVWRSVRRLEELGELRVDRGGGRGKSNCYRLMLGGADGERVSSCDPLAA